MYCKGWLKPNELMQIKAIRDCPVPDLSLHGTVAAFQI
jgi:hypothetical protein